MNKDIKLIDLGLLDYKKAWDFQEKLFQEIIEIKKINRKKSTNLKTPNYLVLLNTQMFSLWEKMGICQPTC